MEISKCYKSGLLIFLGNITGTALATPFYVDPCDNSTLCFVEISGKRSRRTEGRHADFKQKFIKVNANVTKLQRDEEELSGLAQACDFHKEFS